MFLNDPEKQAQYEEDLARGVVPIWNPNDQVEAQSFADYFNTLMGQEVCIIETQTSCNFKFINPE